MYTPRLAVTPMCNDTDPSTASRVSNNETIQKLCVINRCLSTQLCSCLEQSTAARHIRAVTASLPQSPQDTSLQALLPMTMMLCLRSDIVIFGHVNRSSLLIYNVQVSGRRTSTLKSYNISKQVLIAR